MQQTADITGEPSQERAKRWREKYAHRFYERQCKIRDRHFHGTSDRTLDAQRDFDSKLDELLASPQFQSLKPRYSLSSATDDRHALIYYLAADWCAGSLDYVLRENAEDGSDEVYSCDEV